jgi:hypothetical protein
VGALARDHALGRAHPPRIDIRRHTDKRLAKDTGTNRGKTSRRMK